MMAIQPSVSHAHPIKGSYYVLIKCQVAGFTTKNDSEAKDPLGNDHRFGKNSL